MGVATQGATFGAANVTAFHSASLAAEAATEDADLVPSEART